MGTPLDILVPVLMCVALLWWVSRSLELERNVDSCCGDFGCHRWHFNSPECRHTLMVLQDLASWLILHQMWRLIKNGQQQASCSMAWEASGILHVRFFHRASEHGR